MSTLRVLLTNDDGIEAAGLLALKSELERFMQVTVVAPATEQSECGHSVTTKRALSVCSHGDRMFSVDGTPADCVRVGLLEIIPEVDLLISGINHGGNLGADIWMSGTVAAAREAYLRKHSAIAVSQVRHRDVPDDWQRSAKFARLAIEHILDSSNPDERLTSSANEPRSLWNVNLPATADKLLPEISLCSADTQALPLAFVKSEHGYVYKGDYHGRPRTTDSDVDVCFSGRIAISMLDRQC